MMKRPILLSCLMAMLLVAAGGAWGKESKDDSPWKAETFAGLKLRGIGPAFMAGRIADIAIHPQDQSIWYVAVGSGGVWKTTNAGTTWTPIFDEQASYSIGCITLDPNDPDTVWVGSGENVGGRHVGYGDGIYRSRDGGQSWENLGLKNSEHIGNIVVDPRDSNVIYVAAQGPLWSAGGDRGLFKSVDGGQTWQKILGGGEYTGVNEVRMDPARPDVLYASTHQRHRNVAALINGGPESAIHKSTDAGATWRKLEKGLPAEDKGKIGLAISWQDPNVVYATIELAHRDGGFYRSSNGGESWEKKNDYVSGATGPHYYQEIFASPHRHDRVYQMDSRMRVTEDGGATFQPVAADNKHPDDHALAFDPRDPDYLLVGTDGGLYESWDLGKTWKFVANLPVTQFYKVAVDYDEPFYHLVGGTQDNNTQYGPSRTDNVHGIRNSDWTITLFADGHQPAIDPTNPDIIYSEWQQGNLTRFDRVSGEMTYIQPQPEKGERTERFNWDAPILISPHDPARLYYASHRLWRSDDRGDSWRPISGDLSHGRDRLTLPMMGRVWSYDAVWDLLAMSEYATVTSLSESPQMEGLIYAGTDDGLVQVTEDGGSTWRRIDRLPGVEEGFFVNDVKADLFDADAVYVVVDNHKKGDFKPYVLRSDDRGRSWKSIAGDLPERHVVWRLVQDHVNPNLLFVGTEFGIFFSVDAGAKWIKVSGAPTIAFRDLSIQKRENDLVGASFGRGFYVFDDYTPLRHVSAETFEREAELFPVRKAWWYIPRQPLASNEKAFQGDAFFTAPNPPFGAVFTYYLEDALKTRKDTRREKEKEIAKEGGDNPYPGWEELRKEELEEDPAILITVRDAQGEVTRRLTGPVEAGFHRVAWDLRYPNTAAWREGEIEDFFGSDGFLAAPGTYTVSLAKRVDGVVTDLSLTQTFEVVRMGERGLKGMTPDQVAGFLRELAEFSRRTDGANAALGEASTRLDAIKASLLRSTVATTVLDDEARRLERKIEELRDWLNGNQRRDLVNDLGPVPISRRAGVAFMGNFLSTYGPTPHHLRSLEIAREEFADLSRQLDGVLRRELPDLEEKLEAAGVPWTPGRSVPGTR